MSEPTGLDKILGGFAQFSGGVEARPESAIDTQHVATNKTISVSVPHINGDLPGEVASVDFWVDLRQLELAPAEDLLRYRYNPQDDADFETFKAAIADLGEHVPTLMVMPANRDIMVAGKMVHVYRIYDEPTIYYALLSLGRAKARIELVVADSPKALLLRQLSKEGQLRRDPSVLEECHAVRRLNLYYGMTLEEIASHLARDRDDHSKLSTTQVHYMVKIAGLPNEVQDLVHNGTILWTNARMIAADFADDEEKSIQLANLAAQGKRMSVIEFEMIVRRMKGSLCHLETDNAGVIHVINHDKRVKLVGDGDASSALPDVPQYPAMLAKPANIRREISRFEVTVVPAATPDRTAITPSSFDSLRQWISERRSNTPIKDTEAVLYGFIEAIRRQAAQAHLTNAAGQIAPVVESTQQEA